MTHRVIMAEHIVAYEQLHIESSSNTYNYSDKSNWDSKYEEETNEQYK